MMKATSIRQNWPEIPEGMTRTEYLRQLELKIQREGYTLTDADGNTLNISAPPKREHPTLEELRNPEFWKNIGSFRDFPSVTKEMFKPPKAAADPVPTRREQTADRLRQRAKGAVAVALPSLVRLPAWPEAVRGVPNCVLRSALFAVIKRGPRSYQQRVSIAALDGIEILFSGPRLDQADLDVWEQCLHLSRRQVLGERVEFGSRDFLRAIGRSGGGKDAEWLKGALTRLQSSVIEVQDGKRAYSGQMILPYTRDDETGRLAVQINHDVVRLYGEDGWTAVEVEQRRALARQPLAQWLHGFYATHARPFALKVETIRDLCGSENAKLFDFRRELKDALAKVSDATGWVMKIDGDDLVQVSKRPTPSQGRHLLRQSK